MASIDLRKVESALTRAKKAFKSIEDGRVLKQDIYVEDGVQKLKRALRDLDSALKDLSRDLD